MLAAAWAWLRAAPADPVEAGDRRTVDLVGLRVPLRATVVVAVTTFVVLVDYTRLAMPDELVAQGRSPAGMWSLAVQRAILFGLVPLLIVLVGFRDRPARYGLRLGDVRAGVVLTGIGVLVMTPIVLWFTTLPDVRAYYAPAATAPAQVVLTNLVDLTATEFLFRGFLMLTLVRAIGPFGVVVAAWPFVFAHLGKPELELFSTLAGGLVYGWLTWRTGSIVWGALGHTAIYSLVILSAAG